MGGIDFQAGPYRVTFDAWRTRATLQIRTTQDNELEMGGGEDFTVEIDQVVSTPGPGPEIIFDPSGIHSTRLTIQDDEYTYCFNPTTEIVNEGDTFDATLQLSKPAARDTWFVVRFEDLSTNQGSSTSVGSDPENPWQDYRIKGRPFQLAPTVENGLYSFVPDPPDDIGMLTPEQIAEQIAEARATTKFFSFIVPKGETEATLPMEAVDDGYLENNEIFRIHVEHPPLPDAVMPCRVDVIIREDQEFNDLVRYGNIGDLDRDFIEGGQAVEYYLELENPNHQGYEFRFTTADDPTPGAIQATANVDYKAGSYDLTIPPYGTYGIARIPVYRNDNVNTPDETFKVDIEVKSSNGTWLSWPNTKGIVFSLVTIKDNDPIVATLERTGSTGAVNEGDKVEFTVTLSRELIAGEIVDAPLAVVGDPDLYFSQSAMGVTTEDWSLATKSGGSLNTGVSLSGADTTTPLVRFSGVGAQTATLELTVAADDVVENTEAFVVALGPDGNGANGFGNPERRGPEGIATPVGTNVSGGAAPHRTSNSFNVQVNDGSPAKPTIRLAPVPSGTRILEGNTILFTIIASHAPTSPITVPVMLATTGNFGATGASTVTIRDVTTTYTVTTDDDNVAEEDGEITVTLQTGSGYVVGPPSSATVVITDNDGSVGGLRTSGLRAESSVPPAQPVDEITLPATVEAPVANGVVVIARPSQWSGKGKVQIGGGSKARDKDSFTNLQVVDGDGDSFQVRWSSRDPGSLDLTVEWQPMAGNSWQPLDGPARHPYVLMMIQWWHHRR